MKAIIKFPLILSTVAAIVVAGCAKISDIDNLQHQIDQLKSGNIQTIEEQFSSIRTSIASLQSTDKALQSYITTLQTQTAELEKTDDDLSAAISDLKTELSPASDIAEADCLARLEAYEETVKTQMTSLVASIGILQSKDSALQNQIDSLNAYVDSEANATLDWMSATFTTIDLYTTTAGIVADIKSQVESINSDNEELKSDISAQKKELDDAISYLSSELQAKIKPATDNAATAVGSAVDEISAAYKSGGIADAISESEKSFKTWVKVQFMDSYYTVAEMDSKLSALSTSLEGQLNSQKAYLVSLITTLETSANDKIDSNSGLIEELRSNLSDAESAIKTNAADIAQLRLDLAAQKSELEKAYKTAIESAINTFDGKLTEEIAAEVNTLNARIDNEVTTVNTSITTLTGRVQTCENDIKGIKDSINSIRKDIQNLQTQINALLSRVQSITYIPKYADGVERMEFTSDDTQTQATVKDLTLRFDIRPADCADSIALAYAKYLKNTKLDSPLKARAVYTLTKAAAAGDFVNLDIKSVAAEKDQSTKKSTGVLSVTVSPASLGTEFFQGALEASLVLSVSTGSSDIQSDYIRLALNTSKVANYYSTIPFTIKSIGTTSVSFAKYGSPADIKLEYRKNDENWASYSIGTAVELANGNTLQFRAGEGGNSAFTTSNNNSYYIKVTAGTGKLMVYGNIMSLLDRTLSSTSVPAYFFYGLFCIEGYNGNGGLPQLIDASNLQLPATELSEYCYSCMFSNCYNLTAGPAELPATTLAECCYASMFNACKSLISAPKLPATKLAKNSYSAMFYGCSNLSNVEAMFKDTPDESAYTWNWLYGVSPTGVFTKNKAATWDVTGAYAVPSGWTILKK